MLYYVIVRSYALCGNHMDVENNITVIGEESAIEYAYMAMKAVNFKSVDVVNATTGEVIFNK